MYFRFLRKYSEEMKKAEFKQWRNENRTYLKDVVPLDTPYNLQVETSSLCNAKCVYCAHSKKNHGVYEGNMPMELFERILSDSKEFPQKFKVIEMFGFGEPLCNPNLEKMISMARAADITEKINFTTNGLLITPKRADSLIESGVNIIRISLQGLDTETYKNTCGVKIDFDEFISNLSYLYKHKKNCTIRMKIADISLANIPEGENRFKEIFSPIADSIFIERIIPMYKNIEYEKIDSDIHKHAINGRENVQQQEIHKVCHRPFYRLRVAADGKVTADCCDTPNDIYYGDIHNETLPAIWEGSVRKSFLRMQLEGKRFRHPICKDCMLPNDITTEADILDPYAAEILERF